MFGLLHSNADWIFAGLIVCIGIVVMLIKIVRGQIISAILGMAVWIFVFSLHKGSTQGIMTATFAALLFDVIGLPIVGMFIRSK